MEVEHGTKRLDIIRVFVRYTHIASDILNEYLEY